MEHKLNMAVWRGVQLKDTTGNSCVESGVGRRTESVPRGSKKRDLD